MGTIVDVAREAKVSLGTASMVLNHPHRVSPETRRRVTLVMERMGYRPRWSHRRTAPATRNAAFIYPEQAIHDGALSSYYLEVINAAREALGDFLSLSMIRGTAPPSADLMFHQQMTAREFAGVFVLGIGKYNAYGSCAIEAGLPAVLINSVHPDNRAGSVSADYYSGARQALEHVARLGHRRLAMLFGTHTARGASWSTMQISQGLIDAANEHSCEQIQIQVPKREVEHDLTQFCERALQAKATALILGDRLAVKCVDTLAAMGLRVPEDISIISFDNLGLKTSRGQELTSVGYDRKLLGRLAAQMMRQMIENGGSLRWMRSGIATYVCQGQTCGPVRA